MGKNILHIALLIATSVMLSAPSMAGPLASKNQPLTGVPFAVSDSLNLVQTITFDGSSELSDLGGWLLVQADLNVTTAGSGVRTLACTLENTTTPPSPVCINTAGKADYRSDSACTFPHARALDAVEVETMGLTVLGFFNIGTTNTYSVSLFCQINNPTKTTTITSGNISAIHFRSLDGATLLDANAVHDKSAADDADFIVNGGTLTEIDAAGQSTRVSITVPTGGSDILLVASVSPQHRSGALARQYKAQIYSVADSALIGAPGSAEIAAGTRYNENMILVARVIAATAGSKTFYLKHSSIGTDTSAQPTQTRNFRIFAVPLTSSGGTTFNLNGYPEPGISLGSGTLTSGGTTLVTFTQPPPPQGAPSNGRIALFSQMSAAGNGTGSTDAKPWTMTLTEAHQSGTTITPVFTGGTWSRGVNDYRTEGILRISDVDANASGHVVTIKGGTPGDNVLASNTILLGLSLVPFVAPPTVTPTPTGTSTRTATNTGTVTHTGTITPTPVNTDTPTNTPTFTNTRTPTITRTRTPTRTITRTPTITPIQPACENISKFGERIVLGKCTLPEDDGFFLYERTQIGVSEASAARAKSSPLRFVVDHNRILMSSNPSPNRIRCGENMDTDVTGDPEDREVTCDVALDYMPEFSEELLYDSGACVSTYPCLEIQSIYNWQNVRPQVDSVNIPIRFQVKFVCYLLPMEAGVTSYCSFWDEISTETLANHQFGSPISCAIHDIGINMRGSGDESDTIPPGCDVDVGLNINGTDMNSGSPIITIDTDASSYLSEHDIIGFGWSQDDLRALTVRPSGAGCDGTLRHFYIELGCS